MTYLGQEIRKALEEVFYDQIFTVDVREDHVVLRDSNGYKESVISEIMRTALLPSTRYCPIFSDRKIGNKITFTLVPYKLPSFFAGAPDSPTSSPGSQFVAPQQDREPLPQCTVQELEELLEDCLFTSKEESSFRDRWIDQNLVRAAILPAFDGVLSRAVSDCSFAGKPIVEVGSGFAYTLLGDLVERHIRTQPSEQECAAIRSFDGKGKIYQTDIKCVCARLKEKGKSVPFIFGLNVFDVIPPLERLAYFKQISEVQNSGERLLIALDTNPYLNTFVEELQNFYPEFIGVPYARNGAGRKTSFLLIPKKLWKDPLPTIDDLVDHVVSSIKEEMALKLKNTPSDRQSKLEELQKRHQLKIIGMENFFAKRVSEQLEAVGYRARIVYTSFFIKQAPSQSVPVPSGDLLYRSVTDDKSVRSCSATDENLSAFLETKGLSLPDEFSKEEFLMDLRQSGKKLMGAELLLILGEKR